MDSYKLAEVMFVGSSLWLLCTDRQEAEDILTELHRLFPWKVELWKDSSPAGDEMGWRLSGYKPARYASWWLMRQLCLRGWEPLGAWAYGQLAYLFRKHA